VATVLVDGNKKGVKGKETKILYQSPFVFLFPFFFFFAPPVELLA